VVSLLQLPASKYFLSCPIKYALAPKKNLCQKWKHKRSSEFERSMRNFDGAFETVILSSVIK
jgi:hypothetical protein